MECIKYIAILLALSISNLEALTTLEMLKKSFDSSAEGSIVKKMKRATLT